MSTPKKRKVDVDHEQSSSEAHNKRKRPSANDDADKSNPMDSALNEVHYQPWASSLYTGNTHQGNLLSSDISSFNPIFGSTSSSSGYSSRSETDSRPTIYNPTHQLLDTQETPSKLHVTPPAKAKRPYDEVDALPTPPPSSGAQFDPRKVMKKMGYKEGQGLGRNATGRTSIIEESTQKGRRGLGYELEEFDDKKANWDFEHDPASANEDVDWCPTDVDSEVPLNFNDMQEWIEQGPEKKVIDNETEFCDEEILKGVLSAKTVFDKLSQKEMEDARARSNVYETIGATIFLNRAAVKIANIDSITGRMFTDPKAPNSQMSLILSDEPFYFADICAGPGGFSEYILWRKRWRTKGFGFTLKGKSDFTLHKFLAGTSETFDPYYGVDGIHGDGDIFKSENIDALQNYVNKCTKNRGVHIVMADGGFSVEGQENIQEILSKQLYLCQFLTALTILRPDGHFVCKLFDLFTPFSVGLVYLMYRTFHHISIHKPVTSRPANSERYIICKSLRNDMRDIVRPYMYRINVLLNQLRDDNKHNDVLSIVPLNILKENRAFYTYIRTSNNQLGEMQIRNLKKIRAFVSNSSLRDDRQNEIRTECLRLWEIPDESRQKFKKILLNDVQQELFSQFGCDVESILFKTPHPFVKSILDQDRIHSLFDYRCTLSLGDPILLLSCGRSSVFQLDLRRPDKVWTPLENSTFKIELPPYTLLLAERVQEQTRNGSNTRRRSAIYVVDAYFIARENMLVQHDRPTVFMDRYPQLKLFEKAINKPVRADLVPIRIHEQLRLEQTDQQFEKLCASGSLNNIDNEQLRFINNDVDKTPFMSVRGLWIFKFVQNPWTILLSKTRPTKFFHNMASRESIHNAPTDHSHIPSLRSMLEHSFYWDFQNDRDTVQKSAFISFIREKRSLTQLQHHSNNDATNRHH